MKIKLSAFLQMKPNVYIYQKLGWRIALFYMVILGRMYFLLRQEEKRKITASLEKVFGERKGRSELKAMANHVFRGIFCHYYEKIFNAYTDIHGLRTFLFGSVIPQGLERLDHALEAGRRLTILGTVGDQVFEFRFEIGDQAAPQLVEIDIAGAHHRRGILVVDQRQQ